MAGAVWGRFRNYLYDQGYLEVKHSSAFVLSIGNLTWGGTGKTALTAQIAADLISSGYRVAVVSRGYKRKSEGLQIVSDGQELKQSWQDAGDESYWIAKQVPQAVVIVAEDRREALRVLEGNPPDVVLLDDGFQHRRIARDLDLVLVDASENLLHQRVLPLGKLREPIDSLKRADVVVLNHAKIAHIETLNWIASHISAPVFTANYSPVFGKIASVGTPSTPSIQERPEWAGKKLAAFCALGSPQHFFRMLEEQGAEIVFRKSYRDHHSYTDSDLEELQAEAIIHNAEGLITSAKDGVKLVNSWLRIPLFVTEAEMVLDEPGQFYELIHEKIIAKKMMD